MKKRSIRTAAVVLAAILLCGYGSQRILKEAGSGSRVNAEQTDERDGTISGGDSGGEVIEPAEERETAAEAYEVRTGAAPLLQSEWLSDFAGDMTGVQEEEREEVSAMQTASESEEEAEYANLAIADVNDYVNVRSIPGTEGEIVGKIYDGAVAEIIEVAGEEQDWFHVRSGKVEGYIKSEYFLYGDAAAAALEEHVTRYAQVRADRLNIRSEQSADSKRIGYLDNGERAPLLADQGEWLQIRYGDKTGYVSSEYVTIVEEFVYAKSIEEEREEERKRLELAAREREEEQKAQEQAQMQVQEQTAQATVADAAEAPAAYSSNSELRGQIVDYAMQFLGNKYVHGGNSLTEGTDCSGFTSLIYADFGYSISRTPAGQMSGAGKGIDYSEAQPGDIICYGKGGSCSHVAIYIGNGQVIHEANSRKGVVIYDADYDTIIGVRNVIDQ